MITMLRVAMVAAILTLTAGAALADDWVAVRLRGAVLQLVDGEWATLRRGDVVPDSRVIRTLASGSVEFQRGNEHVTLGADTQIQIYDKARAKPFTTVKQYFGTVSVEAEVRDVQHFAVQTQYLAAVVKGTRFTVTANKEGASVTVGRGSVFVEGTASRASVVITAGQSAAVDRVGGKPSVEGSRLNPAGKPNNGVAKALGKTKTDDGKPGKSDDKDSGKSGDDNSGKGKSGDNSGNSGKGKSDDDS